MKAQPKKNSKHILAIDDDPGMLHLLKNILERDGYKVSTSSVATEGLEIAFNELPDCILLDVLMPDMMGVELAGRLQDDPKTEDIPIIFMTVTIDLKEDKGSETITVHNRSYRAFAKPIHNRKLLSVIRKEINKRIHKNI